jgi:pimeloyl-ACP methyl ester carboxylesterase
LTEETSIVDGLWISLWIAAALAASGLLVLIAYLALIIRRYLHVIVRIFEEKPLFVVPRGQPIAGSEEVTLRTADGLRLAGSYLHTTAPLRRGVILFCPEFASNRWSCGAYCESLMAAGFDVFTFEFRNYGDSDAMAGYEPMQWVTEYERTDVEAAVAYLKSRPDADPGGIGLFGISRGGGAGILVAAADPWIRCLVTDGAFGTRTTMLPYMRKWIAIYTHRPWLAGVLPDWVYQVVANIALARVARRRNCRFPGLGNVIGKIAPRALFMIHGELDTYIKPEIARELFDRARGPKEFWLVEGAKHNQALHVAGDQYHQRLVEFFSQQLVPTREMSQVEELVQVS